VSTAVPHRSAASEHAYFVTAALAIAVIIFAGFAPSYYLRAWFDTHSLPLLVHVHGLIMTAWIALFVIQVLLAARRRIALHRRLGILGALLAVLIVIVGMMTLIAAATREVHADPHSPQATFFLMLLCFNTVNLLVFATLVAAAIRLRRQSDWHKRLMLLATASLLGPALARLPLSFFDSNLHALLAVYACILLCAIIDTARHRRLHPVFAWGAPAVIAIFHITYVVAATPAWMKLARMLIA
jgi:hypothetical protein